MFQGCGPPGGLFADALERLRVNQKGKILVVDDDRLVLATRREAKPGFDVAAYLREYCQIPFMFLSAFADEATIKQVKALGALTYLVKPLDIQQIVPAVEAAFANRPNQQAAPAQPAACWLGRLA